MGWFMMRVIAGWQSLKGEALSNAQGSTRFTQWMTKVQLQPLPQISSETKGETRYSSIPVMKGHLKALIQQQERGLVCSSPLAALQLWLCIMSPSLQKAALDLSVYFCPWTSKATSALLQSLSHLLPWKHEILSSWQHSSTKTGKIYTPGPWQRFASASFLYLILW